MFYCHMTDTTADQLVIVATSTVNCVVMDKINKLLMSADEMPSALI